MGITTTAAAVLRTSTRWEFTGIDAAGHKAFIDTWADDLPQPPARSRSGAPKPQSGYIEIINTAAGGGTAQWPKGQPLPPGWTTNPNPTTHARDPHAFSKGPPSVIPYTAPDAEVQALIRQVSRAAAKAALADLREQRQDLKTANILAQRALVADEGPGNRRRTPRSPRPPRPARPPRPPRTPRPKRKPGTKGERPKKPCRRFNSLGACADIRCIPDATIPEPNVGHSSCNWGPVDSCGNCVEAGCNGPAAFLLKPFLMSLPKYWTQKSVQLIQDMRKENLAAARARNRLPPIPQPDPTQPTPPPPPIPTTGQCVAGYMCRDWPGWIICPNCSGSIRCKCSTPPVPVPASSCNCKG
jgi:hypothetical protein